MDIRPHYSGKIGQSTTQRLDIQFLRGIAVLAVLFYHADLFALEGGYVGVDIFFVISGYLITKNILNDLARKRFSFIAFYVRRARRLLPAAYCTLLVTTLLAAKVLTPDRWEDYVDQVLGAVTFTANFVLPLQTGYFETTADTKPLLHTWSLSVEEQYYLLAPLVLWLLRPRWLNAVLIGLAVTSLALCIALVGSRFAYWRLPELDAQQIAFFMLPTRAWEMLSGSLLASFAGHADGAGGKRRRILKIFVLIFLCALCVQPIDSLHPRGDAVLAVLMTAFLIVGDSRWLGNSLPVRAVATVGDWSYSLYLVHWPLFALANCGYLGHVPIGSRIALVGLAILLAFLQYTYVEQPFRHSRSVPTARTLRWLAVISLVVVTLPFALTRTGLKQSSNVHAYRHQPNLGLSRPCADGRAVTDAEQCSTSPRPRVALWGDSYAMHLVPGLMTVDGVGESMIQITKSACAPILGVASLDENYDENWARGCIRFNEQAVDLITQSDSIRYVIMSSPYAGYLDHRELKLFYDEQSSFADRSVVIDRFVATVQLLQTNGKEVILVAPPPKPGFDIGACHEHKALGLLVLGRSECDFQQAEYRQNQIGIIEGLDEVHARTSATVVWFDNLLCFNGRCKTTMDDGRSIYKDGGHLSIPGSVWAIPKLGIEQIIKQ